ncbi:GNAT family N-acetyltransferase [Pannonibacter sp. Pt2-lr]
MLQQVNWREGEMNQVVQVSGAHCAPLKLAGVNVERLQNDAAAFSRFGYPRLARHLTPITAPWVAIGARIAGVPVGLALGFTLTSADGQSSSAHLLSLAVAPQVRNRGIGRALSTAFVKEVQANGASHVSAAYTSRLQHRSALEHVLCAAGFAAPILEELIVFGEAARFLAAADASPAVRRRSGNVKIQNVTPWSQLSIADELALADLQRQPDYVSGFDPAPDAERFEPACSVQVRRDGRLVGWVTAEHARVLPLEGHRDRKAIVYRSAYLTEDLWHGGWLVGGFRPRCQLRSKPMALPRLSSSIPVPPDDADGSPPFRPHCAAGRRALGHAARRWPALSRLDSLPTTHPFM